MGFLIGLVLFVGLIVFSIVADNKSEKKERAKVESDANIWLNLEVKQPQYKVVVNTKNGKTYESVTFGPYYVIQHFFHWTFFKYKSKGLAESRVEHSFKSGRYFHEQTDTYTYIPMCDVETINVVENKNA